MVTFDQGTDLVDVLDLTDELEELLGTKVDVISGRAAGAVGEPPGGTRRLCEHALQGPPALRVDRRAPSGRGRGHDDRHPVSDRRLGQPVVVRHHTLELVAELERGGQVDGVERPQRGGFESAGDVEHP